MHGSSVVLSALSPYYYSQIVALDLGNFNSVACIFDPAGRSPALFHSLATTPARVHDLLSALIASAADAASITVVFEDLRGLWRDSFACIVFVALDRPACSLAKLEWQPSLQRTMPATG